MQCAGSLEAEALIAGRLVRLPKHSHVIEFYGSVEEAEALLGRARVSLEKRNGELAGRLERLQRVVRLLPALLGGSVEASRLLSMVREAARGLPEPEGWSLTGCSPEDPDIMLAIARLRAAERQVSRAAEEGVVPGRLAQEISAVIEEVAYTLYRVHWLLCSSGGGGLRARRVAELLAV